MSRKRKDEITIHITPEQFFMLHEALGTVDSSIGGGDEDYNDWAEYAVKTWDSIISRNKLNPTFKLDKYSHRNE